MGLVHRDIKPHNIFLSRSTPVIAKLGDFGLTSAAEGGSTAHTPRYAPPEVLFQGEVADASGDVFSFGLVIYETLSLERCTRGDHAEGLKDQAPMPRPDEAPGWDPLAATLVRAIVDELKRRGREDLL